MRRLLTITRGSGLPLKRRKLRLDQIARLSLLKKIETWDDLVYWESGEKQVVDERLNDFDRAKRKYCPDREYLYAALDAVPLDKVKVMWVGQDPYPNPKDACGIAFSVKKNSAFPPTLQNIFQEYQDDLHRPAPSSGDLSSWCERGVLLWNAYPSCFVGQPGSHHWPEYAFLTTEIIKSVKAHRPRTVFIFSGNSARGFAPYADGCHTIETSHPSPRGSLTAKKPFLGSRVFSTVNAKLVAQGEQPIDWRLP